MYNQSYYDIVPYLFFNCYHHCSMYVWYYLRYTPTPDTNDNENKNSDVLIFITIWQAERGIATEAVFEGRSVGVYILRGIWILMWLGFFYKKYPCKYFWKVFINLEKDFGRSCCILALAALIRSLVCRLDEFRLSILWERKAFPRLGNSAVETGHTTHRPSFGSPGCSLRKSHKIVRLKNSK